MTTSTDIPVLYEFPVSHYCEKARWALEWKGISYRSHPIAPAAHRLVLRRIGAPESYVPVLSHRGNLVQGSDRILRYLDETFDGPHLYPPGAQERAEVERWERWLDDVAGRVVRRVVYDEILHDRALTLALWSEGVPRAQAWLCAALYPVMKPLVRRAYKIDEESVRTGIEAFESLVDALDRRLSQHRWLVGGTFSAADLTACALIAPICRPPGHPFSYPETPRAFKAYRERPFWSWVHRTYAEQRAGC